MPAKLILIIICAAFAFSSGAQDLKDWFVFTPEDEPSGAITDMADWLSVCLR